MTSWKQWLMYIAYMNVTVGIALWYTGAVQASDPLEYGNFTFTPSQENISTLFAKDETNLLVVFPHCELEYTQFIVEIGDKRILKESHEILAPNLNENITCYTANVTLYAKNIGRSNITFTVKYPTENNPCTDEIEIVEDYEVKAMRKRTIELEIFRFGTMFFLIILNFGFGCSLNLEVVKEILKKPFAPAVGFTCQYVMMPIIGFCVSMTLLRDDKLFGFGLICSSCSPGGSGSNVWCLLLGGDVSLSLTMTFFSISASLVMMPLWIFLEGRFFIDTGSVAIPYIDILLGLFFFVVPLFMGIIFRKFKEKGAEMVGKGIKPFAFLFLLFLLTYGLYVNRYVYTIIGAFPYILIPALLQPYVGFGLGFLIAKTIGRQSRQRAITIAIETGVQNITIPMVLLQNSFEQPLGDIAAVMPVTTAHFTPLPLMIVFLVLFFRKRFCPPKKEDTQDDEKDEAELNKGVIETMTIDVSNGQTKLYPDVPYDTTEKEVFLSGMNKAEIDRKFSELDQETVI